jgi:inhibitor of KinA
MLGPAQVGLQPPRVLAAGDSAAMAVLGDEMSLEMSRQVLALAQAVQDLRLPGVWDVVPAYCTLLVHYDPCLLSFEEVRSWIGWVTRRPLPTTTSAARLRNLPTAYGGEYGPDLTAVAERLRTTEEEVIRLHSMATFTVCTLGFAPGQPYVVGLPPELRLPRRDSPRQLVPVGSVLIANQTVVYPVANPTGWWWIGRTPLSLFSPSDASPTYLQPGDQMRFIPIQEEEYFRLGGEKAG